MSQPINFAFTSNSTLWLLGFFGYVPPNTNWNNSTKKKWFTSTTSSWTFIQTWKGPCTGINDDTSELFWFCVTIFFKFRKQGQSPGHGQRLCFRYNFEDIFKRFLIDLLAVQILFELIHQNTSLQITKFTVVKAWVNSAIRNQQVRHYCIFSHIVVLDILHMYLYLCFMKAKSFVKEGNLPHLFNTLYQVIGDNVKVHFRQGWQVRFMAIE